MHAHTTRCQRRGRSSKNNFSQLMQVFFLFASPSSRYVHLLKIMKENLPATNNHTTNPHKTIGVWKKKRKISSFSFRFFCLMQTGRKKCAEPRKTFSGLFSLDFQRWSVLPSFPALLLMFVWLVVFGFFFFRGVSFVLGMCVCVCSSQVGSVWTLQKLLGLNLFLSSRFSWPPTILWKGEFFTLRSLWKLIDLIFNFFLLSQT